MIGYVWTVIAKNDSVFQFTIARFANVKEITKKISFLFK